MSAGVCVCVCVCVNSERYLTERVHFNHYNTHAPPSTTDHVNTPTRAVHTQLEQLRVVTEYLWTGGDGLADQTLHVLAHSLVLVSQHYNTTHTHITHHSSTS